MSHNDIRLIKMHSSGCGIAMRIAFGFGRCNGERACKQLLEFVEDKFRAIEGMLKEKRSRMSIKIHPN